MDILKNLKRNQKGELQVTRPTVGSAKSPEKFLGGVVHEALQYTMRNLPQPVRDRYNGDVQHTEDLTSNAWSLKITLTHLQTRNVIVQNTVIHNDRIKQTTNPVKFASELGVDIGRRLVTDIKAAEYQVKRTDMPPNKSITGKWDQEYPKHQVAAAEAQSMPIIDVDPDSFKEKPKPPKLCDICGVTDDKYPDWIECSHNLDTSA